MPFGVVAAVASGVASVASAVGIGAAAAGTIGAIAAPALVGAGVGALGSEITGGDPLKGAELGGLGGLGGGIGGVLGGAGDLGGLTAAEGGALGGAVGGLAGGAATGGNLLLDTAGGALSGYASNGGFSGSSSLPTTGGVGGGGTSAAATAAPAGTATGGAGDLTSGIAPTESSTPVSPAITSQTLGLPSAAAPGAGASPLSSAPGFASSASPSAAAGLSAGTSTGASGGTATAGAGSGTTFGSFLKNPSLAGAESLAEKNPGAVVGALGLGYDALQKSSTPQEGNLSGIAGNLDASGQQLMSYLNSGKLPPGAQQAVDSAKQANQAAIRQQYAANGLSGSTMETQALEAANTAATTQALNIATQLAQDGASETQISAELYNSIASMQQQSNSDMTKAISEFAAAMVGSPPSKAA